MKIFKINQKVLYVLSCILVTFFLYGCKEKDVDISVFDELPDSPLLTQVKSSLENHVPIAIAFTAEWCPHCRNYKPVFSDVKDLYHDKVTFINIDVDDVNGSPISSRFQVRGIPTTAFVRADGSVYKLQVGEITKDELIKTADELISNRKRKKGEPVAPFPLDLNKKEKATEEAKKEEAKPEETKPVEEAPPPEVQKAPKEELQPPLGGIQLPPPPSPVGEPVKEPESNVDKQDAPDSGKPADETPVLEEPAPE